MDNTKIKNNNKNLYVFFSSFILYVILFLIKDFIFSFLNININKISSTIVNIEYQIFIISTSIIYFISTKKKDNYKEIFIDLLIGFLTIATYFILSGIEVPILKIFKITSETPQFIKSIAFIIYSIITLLLLILINKNSLKKDVSDLKKNHKMYFSKYIKYWFFATIIMMFSNLIITSINNGNIAQNEATIRETFKLAPIYTLFSAVIFAPIAEELVFRRALKNIISSKYAFIIASGLIFGGLHIITSINSISDFLYIIPYSIHGLTFAYILQKTDNVTITIGLHLLHNGIMMSLQTLLFILGAL